MARQTAVGRFLMSALAALLLAAVITVLAARFPDPRVTSTVGWDEALAALLSPGEGVLTSPARVSRGEPYEWKERTRPVSVPMGLAIAGSFLSAIMLWRAVQPRRSRTSSFLHSYLDGPRAPPVQLD
jgi:hypothetical protein